MRGYYIRPTKVTPSLYFNPKRGILDLRGRSCPENPLNFYKYLFNSLDRFALQSEDHLRINLAFEYFNTSSSKCLFVCLRKLSDLQSVGKTVVVNWYYETEDEDMIETGEDMKSFFTIPFNFIEIEEIKILGSLRNVSNSLNAA